MNVASLRRTIFSNARPMTYMYVYVYVSKNLDDQVVEPFGDQSGDHIMEPIGDR